MKKRSNLRRKRKNYSSKKLRNSLYINLKTNRHSLILKISIPAEILLEPTAEQVHRSTKAEETLQKRQHRATFQRGHGKVQREK